MPDRLRHNFPPSFPSACQVSFTTRLFCSLVPRHHFRLPGRYTSPLVLSEDLSSEKTERATSTPIYVALTQNSKRLYLLLSLTLHHTLLLSFDAWPHQRLPSVNVCASQTYFEKPLNPFHFTVSSFPSFSSDAPSFFCKKALNVLQPSESPTSFLAFLIIKRYFLSFFCWFSLHFDRFTSSFNCLMHTLWVVFAISPSSSLIQRTFVRWFFFTFRS